MSLWITLKKMGSSSQSCRKTSRGCAVCLRSSGSLPRSLLHVSNYPGTGIGATVLNLWLLTSRYLVTV
jgi:hypothetical protein